MRSVWIERREGLLKDEGDRFKLVATRTGIKNSYATIPLHIMADYMEKEGMTLNKEIMTNYSVPDELKELKRSLDRYLESPEESASWHWNQENTWAMNRLRHDYLHFSAHYGGFLKVHAPQFTKGGKLSGQRKREIHEG